MGSADFSQFVVTTANGTVCETSTHKVRALSLRVPAAFTHTSSNFWTSSLLADLSVFLSLICGSCPSGQRFAYSFLQIPSHDGHPCCSAMRFVVAYVRSGLSPVRARPWRAYSKKKQLFTQLFFCCPVPRMLKSRKSGGSGSPGHLCCPVPRMKKGAEKMRPRFGQKLLFFKGLHYFTAPDDCRGPA